MELKPEYQKDVSALSRIYVHGTGGQLVPVSQFARFAPTTIAASVNHQSQFPAVTLSFNLAPDTSIGQAVDQIERATAEMGMPRTVQASFQGTAQAFQSSLVTEPYLRRAACAHADRG